LEGGAILWKSYAPIISNNDFLNNTAIYGEKVGSYPIRMEVEVIKLNDLLEPFLYFSTFNNSQKKIILDQICPGNEIQYEIIIYLVDHYQKIVNSSIGY
jgi:hypothetical protein